MPATYGTRRRRATPRSVVNAPSRPRSETPGAAGRDASFSSRLREVTICASAPLPGRPFAGSSAGTCLMDAFEVWLAHLFDRGPGEFDWYLGDSRPTEWTV